MNSHEDPLNETGADAPAAPTPATGTPEPAEAQEPAQEASEDIFALTERARQDNAGRGGPTILRKPTNIKAVTKIKPWFMVHPAGVYRGLDIFMDPNSEEIEKTPHYVAATVADDLWGVDGLKKFTGYLCCTINGTLQLLLVPEPDEDGKLHEASSDKHEACSDAINGWTRLVWKPQERQYEIMSADWPNRHPKWPEDVSSTAIMRRVFKKAVVADMDHPLVKLALGEE